ncbi:hypothetical protein SDC9_183966 [bioreactor metagenome]|uniref:Uncharacterized protein n=1 Tax=bioreactor metagenome TaxID=1076179 RepID=A0A645HBQ1_9ZZZZ
MCGPFDEHIHVSVPADAGELLDFGVDADGLAKELHLLCAFQQGAAERARRLKADEQNRVGGVPKIVLEVVLDASGLAHSTRGEDDFRTRVSVQCHRFLTGFRDGQPIK